MNANATQLRLDVRAPEHGGDFRFYYQNDFFGSGSDTGDMKYRVQHIYGQFYGFKAGFTYGVLEDPDSWPDTVDYEGPNAVIFSRRPVAQYTVAWNDNWNTTFGVEKAGHLCRHVLRSESRRLHADRDAGPRVQHALREGRASAIFSSAPCSVTLGRRTGWGTTITSSAGA